MCLRSHLGQVEVRGGLLALLHVVVGGGRERRVRGGIVLGIGLGAGIVAAVVGIAVVVAVAAAHIQSAPGLPVLPMSSVLLLVARTIHCVSAVVRIGLDRLRRTWVLRRGFALVPCVWDLVVLRGRARH